MDLGWVWSGSRFFPFSTPNPPQIIKLTLLPALNSFISSCLLLYQGQIEQGLHQPEVVCIPDLDCDDFSTIGHNIYLFCFQQSPEFYELLDNARHSAFPHLPDHYVINGLLVLLFWSLFSIFLLVCIIIISLRYFICRTIRSFFP